MKDDIEIDVVFFVNNVFFVMKEVVCKEKECKRKEVFDKKKSKVCEMVEE